MVAGHRERGASRSARASRARAVHAIAALLFALLAIAPLSAQALLLPTCDAEPVATRMPAPACEVVTAFDDVTGESSAAPICDPAGISAIAPPRVLPVGDERLEASRSCASVKGAPSMGPRADEPAASGGPALAGDVAASPPDALLRRSSEMTLLQPFHVSGRPLRGIARSVYHPPR